MNIPLHTHKNTKIFIEPAGFQHEDDIHNFYQTQKSALGPLAYFLKGKTGGDIARLLKKGALYLARNRAGGPITGMAAVTPCPFIPDGQTMALAPDIHRAFTATPCAEVNSLVIAAGHARTGLATTLLASCESWGRTRKISGLFAKVVSGAIADGTYKPGNMAARNVFTRQGYHYLGDTKRNTDPNIDLWVMGKVL